MDSGRETAIMGGLHAGCDPRKGGPVLLADVLAVRRETLESLFSS